MQGKKLPKYHNFNQIFTFWGLLCPSPSTDPGQIWQETVYDYTTYLIWIHLLYYLPRSKNRNFGLILTFGWILYSVPFMNQSQIWYASVDPPSTLMYQISSWSESHKFCCFLDFRMLWCRQLAAYREIEQVCTTTNILLSNCIKIVSVLQRLQGEIVHTNSVVHKPSFTGVTSQASWIGTTVFRGMRNFEPSHGICPFPRNSYISTEFHGIPYWLVISYWH